VTTTADITWGGLDFVNPEAAPPAEGYLVHAMAGTDFGNPQPLIETVKSMLTDGSLAVLEGWDNREVQIHLRISAPRATAGPALAAAEAVLFAQVQAEVKAPLVYVPPAPDAPTCVFDVVVAKLDRDTSDNWDIQEQTGRAYRYYLLTLICLPFVRGEDTVVVSAIPTPPPTPTTVLIDACTSTTNWSVVNGGSLSTSGGAVLNQVSAPTKAGLLRTASVTMGATPYLKITFDAAQYPLGTPPPTSDMKSSVTFRINGTPTDPLLVLNGVAYLQPPSSFNRIQVDLPVSPSGSGSLLSVADISRTDTIPSTGTTRQLSRTATVGGSAPTQAAIRLFDPTPAALGTEILVHSSRNSNWQPALRPYRTASAAVTADTAMVSGNRNTLTSSMVFRIPANLLTEGTYALLARMLVSTAGTLTWSAKMVSSTGAATVGSSVVTTGSAAVPTTAGAYKVLNLAAIPLPVLKVESDQMVELTLTGSPNMTIDEGWLFGLHDGALTWLQDTDSLTWIEIRSPELGAPRPSVYGGTGAKGTNSACVDWKCQSFGAHRFEPGLMQIFTVTSTSLVSQSEIEFYDRGHSHMAAA
jgi:hypothetical protein